MAPSISNLLDRSQLIEALTCISSFLALRRIVTRVKALHAKAPSEAGHIKTYPSTKLGKLISPIHGWTLFGPTYAHIGIVTMCGLRKPLWLEGVGLPMPSEMMRSLGSVGGYVGLGSSVLDGVTRWVGENDGLVKMGVRLAACGVACGVATWTAYALGCLGSQVAPIGVREKPQVISTGPFAAIRHPAYSGVIALNLCLVPMFWSYVPLVTAGLLVTAFAVKIPIEEGLIEEDPIVGEAYKEYKGRVRSRLIPYIW